MKKIILFMLLCIVSLSYVAAQEAGGNINPFVNKRGIPYLPEAGDFALGVDASPFLNYLGNLFDQTGSNKAPEFENGLGIYGKYFIDDNQAIRAKLYLEFSKTAYKQTVPNDNERLVDPTNTNATVVDVKNDFNNDVLLSLGYELRRGKGRLQGFYGADLFLGYGNLTSTYKYANPMTVANQAPSTADFITGGNSYQNYRKLEEKTGYTFTTGLGAFVGVEYFITSLISLGGEFNLNFFYGTTGQKEVTSEYFLGNEIKEAKSRERAGKDEAFQTGLFTKPTGSLFVMFHF
jgi:hypothetical protein